MDKERNCYYTLGLPLGSPPTEIKAAYRRLVKLYHPDHDQSLDAEVKYKQIRVAYETLRDLYLAEGASSESVTKPDSSERTTWTSKAWRAEEATWTYADWTTEYDISDKRMPVKWKRFFLALLGGIPLSLLFDGIGYAISAFVLAFAAYFLCPFFERYAFDDNVAGRMYFWIPFTVSTEGCLFAYSSSLIYYIFPIILCVLGLFMPLEFLTKDPRSSSQWLDP